MHDNDRGCAIRDAAWRATDEPVNAGNYGTEGDNEGVLYPTVSSRHTGNNPHSTGMQCKGVCGVRVSYHLIQGSAWVPQTAALEPRACRWQEPKMGLAKLSGSSGLLCMNQKEMGSQSLFSPTNDA